MKKLFAISILLTLITAAAFAQFKVGAEVNFQGDILKTAAPLDDNRDTSKGGYEKRYFNFLSSYNSWIDSGIKLNLKYTDPADKDDPKYGGLLQIDLNGLWAVLIANKDAPNHATFMNIVQAPFGDWNAWGKVGILKGFVGNTDNNGAVGTAKGVGGNDYMDKFHFGDLGIIYYKNPTATGIEHSGVNMLNLKPDAVYVSVEAILAPITIAVAGDLSGIVKAAENEIMGPTLASNDTQAVSSDSHTGIGAAFRLSGDVLSMLKFDAIYKITGGEKTTDANQRDATHTSTNGYPQPNHDGSWLNRFGLFGNINLLDDLLGVTAGYSGEFRVDENGQNADYVYPYYNGIDLRAYLNLSDALKLSFNNNLSFSTIKGASGNTIVTGISNDGALTHPDMSQGYFGMYNALLLNFSLSDELAAHFQIGNRLYAYGWTNKANGLDQKIDVTTDELQLNASAWYTLKDHVTLGSGLVFNIYHTTRAEKGQNDIKAGIFTFGIPITVKVAY